MKRWFSLFLTALLFFSLFIGCKSVLTGDKIYLMSWNVQNLFDGVHNGGEYKEFDPAYNKWNESLFHDRLKNISEIILKTNPPFGPDIVVLMEVENANCLEQLNRFYLPQCGYAAPLVSKNPQGVQTALLTRLPILSINSYRLTTTPPMQSTRLRDIMEVELKTPKGNCIIFINHWKSRLGGEDKTEFYRLQSATVLSHRLKELNDSFFHQKEASKKQKRVPPIIICGDFNESFDQFAKNGGKKITALLPFDEKLSFEENRKKLNELKGYSDFYNQMGIEPQPLFFAKPPFQETEASSVFPQTDLTQPPSMLLYNLWEWEDEAQGSYFFRGKWETLDHFFVNEAFWQEGGLKLHSFEVIKEEKLLTKAGYPKKWITSLRQGYSDHLPLLLQLH